MFIFELWRFNKMGCILLVTFLCAFVFINYRHGAVAAPIFQYGMFSGFEHIQDTQNVYQLVIDDKVINAASLTSVERDLIQTSLTDYFRHREVNRSVNATMKRIFHVGPDLRKTDTAYYSDDLNEANYIQWYSHLLASIFKQPFRKWAVYESEYIWSQDRLVVKNSSPKLQFIAARY